MEGGSSSETGDKVEKQRGLKLGSVLPKIEPFKPRKNFYDPRELRSWAKKTGFVSTFSGETDRGSVSGRTQNESGKLDLERGIVKKGSLSPTIELDPILGRTRNRGTEIEQDLGFENGRNKKESDGVLGMRDRVLRAENQRDGAGVNLKNAERREGLSGPGNGNAIVGASGSGNGDGNGNGNGNGVQPATPVTGLKKEDGDGEEEMRIPAIPDDEGQGYGGWHQSPKLKCGPGENPGYGQYGFVLVFSSFSFCLMDISSN